MVNKLFVDMYAEMQIVDGDTVLDLAKKLQHDNHKVV